MLDQVLIFSKTGVVLWSKAWTTLKGDPVNAVIHQVLLEVSLHLMCSRARVGAACTRVHFPRLNACTAVRAARESRAADFEVAVLAPAHRVRLFCLCVPRAW